MSASKPGLGKCIFSRLDSRRNAFRNPWVTVGFTKTPFCKKPFRRRVFCLSTFAKHFCLFRSLDMMLSEYGIEFIV